MPLSYYLLKPVKRVTDYPTFVEKLLKNTPSSHPDWGQLNEALTRAKSLCDQVTKVKHFDVSVKLQFGKLVRIRVIKSNNIFVCFDGWHCSKFESHIVSVNLFSFLIYDQFDSLIQTYC